jgi:hypothetical protein
MTLYFADEVHFLSVTAPVLGFCSFAGFLCRRLAYPELTDEEAFAPEPLLSLFQK